MQAPRQMYERQVARLPREGESVQLAARIVAADSAQARFDSVSRALAASQRGLFGIVNIIASTMNAGKADTASL